MARLARSEVFDPDEVAIGHFYNRTTRRCFLMGEDPISGKNFDHRKVWIEEYLRGANGDRALRGANGDRALRTSSGPCYQITGGRKPFLLVLERFDGRGLTFPKWFWELDWTGERNATFSAALTHLFKPRSIRHA